MKRKNTISNKISYIRLFDRIILIWVFVLFVILIAAMVIGTKNYKQNQTFMVHDFMEIVADNEKIQFEQYIDSKVSLLQGLVKFSDIYEMDEQKQKDFIKDHSELLGFHHLFVVRPDGMVFYPEESLYRNQKDEPFFHNVMNQDVFVSEPWYGTDITIMTIAVSIFRDGKKVGVLCGAIELKEIQELFRNNRMVLNGSSNLINREGYYVVAEKMDKVYDKINIYEEADTQAGLIQNAFQDRKDKTGVMFYEGVEYQTHITYLENFDWVLVQCVKVEDIFKDLVYIDIWKYILLLIVAVIIIFVIRISIYWKRSNKKINTDTLTGCGSRLFIQTLIAHLNLSKKYDVAVIYLDLNKFKQINDTCGHDVGDQILCMFSEVLVSVFGNDGSVGRIGGDEFMVVMLNADEDEIIARCEKVNTELIKKVKILSLPHRITTSYGYAIREKGSTVNLNMIVDQADKRMYDYKDKHR